ncbi:MAG: NAD(P)/FAD-dependent oxidoreductase [Candidatus Thermoplasmatota archaeon]|nr:NAD(P)/FAD-dependent oxidoreductase [Candidatus Thermoplasmatota archaeon]
MSDDGKGLQTGPENEVWDVIIVGGGPAGMASAIYSARGGLRTLIIDKDKGSGAMGGPHQIENYPGFPGPIKASDLLERFREQARNLGAQFVQENIVYTDFRKEEKLLSSPVRTFKGRTVILATGSMGREPSIEGEGQFIGRGVHYCAICDGPNMKGKHVAVVGQPTRLGDELELLSTFASRISVFSMVGPFDEESLDSLRSFSKVSPMEGKRIMNIPEGPEFKGVLVRSSTGEEGLFECDALFIYLMGNRPVTDYIADSLEKGDNGCIRTYDGATTSLKGVYAAGDITCREVRQISLAVAEGMRSALSAQAYLRGNLRPSSQWGLKK